MMATCEVCGNEYEGAFQIKMNDKVHVFDCFECAVHALAPSCQHCKCRVLGHGVQADGRIYCCAHCARQAGDTAMKGRGQRLDVATAATH